jgi:hypothetical protein
MLKFGFSFIIHFKINGNNLKIYLIYILEIEMYAINLGIGKYSRYLIQIPIIKPILKT